MITHNVIPDSSGFPVRWFGEVAVVELPAGRNFLKAPALAGELCAALDAGAAMGLILDLSGGGVCDSARFGCFDAGFPAGAGLGVCGCGWSSPTLVHAGWSAWWHWTR